MKLGLFVSFFNCHMSRAMRKCVLCHANNKGADQTAHPHRLISAFVVHCLDSIISLDSIAKISRLASFCGCTGRFASGLVRNSRRHVLSCHGSYFKRRKKNKHFNDCCSYHQMRPNKKNITIY